MYLFGYMLYYIYDIIKIDFKLMKGKFPKEIHLA